MPARMKVFQAHLGFYDTVVAAPSQKAALAAWGSRQDLFREGYARTTNDVAAVTAALAKPGVVLSRPAGSGGAFREKPELPEVPAAPKKRPSIKPAEPVKTERTALPSHRPRQEPPKPKPKPDRRPLDAAEKALADVKAEEQRKHEALKRRREELDEEERRLKAEFLERRKKAQHAVERARAAYRKAFG